MRETWNKLKLILAVLLFIVAGVYAFISVISLKLLGILIVSVPLSAVGYWLFSSASKKLEEDTE